MYTKHQIHKRVGIAVQCLVMVYLLNSNGCRWRQPPPACAKRPAAFLHSGRKHPDSVTHRFTLCMCSTAHEAFSSSGCKHAGRHLQARWRMQAAARSP